MMSKATSNTANGGMSDNCHISDEMMARYLCGMATPDEESVVLDYLSKNDEHLDDFLAMTAAIEKFEKYGELENKRPPRHGLWPAISIAASVALLIGIGIALFHKTACGTAVDIDPAPAYAAQDSLEKYEK